MNGPLDLHPKVVGGTAAGALSLIIVWSLSLGHVAVPDSVAAAMTLLLTFAGGWLAPAGRSTEPTTGG